MEGIIEMGKVCKMDSVLFVQYQVSPVLTDINTFYLNTENGKTTNFFTPSVTQWHWNPEVNVDFEELKQMLMDEKEVIECKNQTDMWFQNKMKEVLKMLN